MCLSVFYSVVLVLNKLRCRMLIRSICLLCIALPMIVISHISYGKFFTTPIYYGVICVCVYVCVCVRACIYVCMYVYMYVCIDVCMYVCMHTCMYVYVLMYDYIYVLFACRG